MPFDESAVDMHPRRIDAYSTKRSLNTRIERQAVLSASGRWELP